MGRYKTKDSAKVTLYLDRRAYETLKRRGLELHRSMSQLVDEWALNELCSPGAKHHDQEVEHHTGPSDIELALELLREVRRRT